MAEFPPPVLAIIGTYVTRGRLPVDTLFAFRAGSDPVSVLREVGVTHVPLFAVKPSPQVELNLDRILIVPDDIDKCPDIVDVMKPLLKATRTLMNVEERKLDLYGSDVTAIYLGSSTYFPESTGSFS